MTSTLTIGGYRISDSVLGAVRDASRRTGADFRFMMANAAQESGFQADAEAPTSSATGLYQFIETTWLQMVRDHGAEHGLGGLSRQIADGADGKPTVADPAMRRSILDLRRDPRLNAVMAGEFANANQQHLERTVGGEIGSTELYLAHFLGAKGAATFLNAQRATPDRPAAELFPAAARANRSVFFDRETGAPRSLDAVFKHFDRRLDDTMTATREVEGQTEARRPLFADFTNSRAPAEPMEAGPVLGPNLSGLSLWSTLFLNGLPVPDSTR
jgi:hypothetical protein